MFLRFIFVSLFLGATVNAFSCPPNALPSPTNRPECYLLVPDNQYFLEAEEICEKNGGNLVSIHNMLDNMFIAQEALKLFDKSTSGDFWFGISNIVSSTWSWMDSSPYDFVNWKDESTLNRTDALCGAVLLESGKWINDYCLIKKPFVCSVPVIPDVVTEVPPPPPTTLPPTPECPESWVYYETTGFCYKVFDDADWHAAENGCRKNDAHLASIHSLEEAMFVGILAYIPGAEQCDGFKQAWIGLYSNDNSLSWQWTDGTPFDYNKWGVSQPDKPESQHCVQLFSSSNQCNWHVGDFNNFVCTSKLSSYICKKAPTF